MSRRVKVLVLVWGLAWLGIGGLAALGFVVTAAVGWDAGFSLAVPMLAGLGGGGSVTAAAALSFRNKPGTPLRLPPAWSLAGGLVLALAAGLGLWQAGISEGFLVPLFATAASVLAPLAVAAWLIRRDVSTPRGLAALGFGATASVVLALVLNTLLAGVLALLIFGLGDDALGLIGETLDLLSGGLFGDRWALVEMIAALVEIAILVPLVEELVKPVALLPVLKRLPAARDALLAGVLAGTGFAAVENLLYATMFGEQWGGVLAARSLGAALHPFGAGVMAVAWWGLLRREPDASRHWLRNYAVAVGVHGLWNGTSIVAATLAATWFQGWEISVLGITEGAVLLALLALEGVGLLLLLRAVSRRLDRGTPAGTVTEATVPPALPSDRAIAVWGVLCLVVLLPVGLGILRTVW